MKNESELADYIYTWLFGCIILFWLWINPFGLYTKSRKLRLPLPKVQQSPFESLQNTHRRYRRTFNNVKIASNVNVRRFSKVQLQGNVHRVQ